MVAADFLDYVKGIWVVTGLELYELHVQDGTAGDGSHIGLDGQPISRRDTQLSRFLMSISVSAFEATGKEAHWFQGELGSCAAFCTRIKRKSCEGSGGGRRLHASSEEIFCWL